MKRFYVCVFLAIQSQLMFAGGSCVDSKPCQETATIEFTVQLSTPAAKEPIIPALESQKLEKQLQQGDYNARQ